MSAARYLDPAGERYGVPTFPWGWARVHDPDLATRAQLRALGLRPGGQQPAAQLMWRSRRAARSGGVRIAWLYRISRAAPVRPMTAARWAAVEAALRARRTCRACRVEHDYYLPTSMDGCCPECFEAVQAAEVAAVWAADEIEIEIEMGVPAGAGGGRR